MVGTIPKVSILAATAVPRRAALLSAPDARWRAFGRPRTVPNLSVPVGLLRASKKATDGMGHGSAARPCQVHFQSRSISSIRRRVFSTSISSTGLSRTSCFVSRVMALMA